MVGMFKKKPILKYKSVLDQYQNTITPAKNHIPDWYKKIPKWKNNEIYDMEKGLQNSLKQCVPFMETMSTGYMIVLPYDVYVKNDMGFPLLTWKSGVEFPPKSRGEASHKLIVPAGHHSIEFVWDLCTQYQFPKEYSFLFTHPLNRHDLPFTTLSGIIDGDFAMSAHGNVPFFVKKGFEGLIPQGTPVAQLIPFRRENWKSEISNNLDKTAKLHDGGAGLVLSGYYKKNFWKRKNYD